MNVWQGAEEEIQGKHMKVDGFLDVEAFVVNIRAPLLSPPQRPAREVSGRITSNRIRPFAGAA